MSVQVAVRVRPFNGREMELNSELIVDMKGKTTVLNHPDPKKHKEYTFDYSFWSHDEFEINEEGHNVATGTKYNDQRSVYDSVGAQILDNAWEGYNCCLFAYGQTGAGKSYSMIGYKPNVGIVPIACQEIFKRIDNANEDNVQYEVFCSMMEIYCEKVQDLLVPISKRPKGGLAIRENKAIGFYVDNLTKLPVDSYEAIEQVMDDGSKNRTVASTEMNAVSSRAHTLITIFFKRIEKTKDKKIEKTSIINLVDLAGSEKVGKTGASGDRLKEAGQINKSLSTLGLVISTLVDSQNGKNVKVPFRDSCLTKILANALGGNSKTLMICAISPALDNYEETLSTLRYADQAKKIKNKAVINESATDKLIRELTTQNDELQKKIQGYMVMMEKFGGDPAAMMKELGNSQIQTMKNEMKEVKDQLDENKHLIDDNSKDYKQAIKDTKQQQKDLHSFTNIDTTKPYMTNLNEDPQLTKKMQYSLTEEQTHIGKKNGNPTPSIILNTVLINPNHATIHNIEGKLYIEPVQKECGDYIFLNGDKVFEKKQLFNQDRVILGSNSAFLVIIPDSEVREGQELPKNVDWEFAQIEINKKEEELKKQELDAMQKKIDLEIEEKNKAAELKYQQQKLEIEQNFKQQEDEFQKKILEIQQKNLEEKQEQQAQHEKAEIERQIQESKEKFEKEKILNQLKREKETKKIQQAENLKVQKIKDKNNIENKLTKILPRIVEVNLIAKELKRNIIFQAKLANTNQSDLHKKLKIQIQVFNKEEGTIYLWDLPKFSNRYHLIKDLLDRYFETNEIPQLDKSEDPFWDPVESQMIGQGYLKLLSLVYLMDSPSNITIVGDNGSQGSIKVNLIPTDDSGEINLGEDMQDEADMIEEPEEMLQRKLQYLVVIESVKLSTPLKKIFVEYSIFNEDKQEAFYQTQTIQEKTSEPQFNYKQKHIIQKVDEEILEYFKKNTMSFKVYAEEEIEQDTSNVQYQQNKSRAIQRSQTIEEEGEEQLHPNDLFTDEKTLRNPTEKQKQNNVNKTSGSKNTDNITYSTNNTTSNSSDFMPPMSDRSHTRTTTKLEKNQQQSQQQQLQQQYSQEQSYSSRGASNSTFVPGKDAKKNKKKEGKDGKKGNCVIF